MELEDIYDSMLVESIDEQHFFMQEGLDNPYPWRSTFKTEEEVSDWDDDGNEYAKDILLPTQIVRFRTEDGKNYIWYAKQNKYNDKYWELAFGAVKTETDDGGYELDIGITGTGNAFRIFATVIDITNSFIEYDGDNYEVQNITISSKGNNRTSLYKKYILPRIDGFKITEEITNDDETEIHLKRTF